MEKRVVLLLCLSVWGVTGKVDHAELRGEHPNQEDIDNGQCVPILCQMGTPTTECKKLCDSRHYETICQPPAGFCLCRHLVHGKMTLVSPDEVMDQAPDSAEVDRSRKSKAEQEPVKVINPEPTKDQEQSETDSEDGVVSFQIFAVLLPIKQFLYESLNEGDTPEPTADTLGIEYETVNVHEGRLFWDFRYILTGLLLLMVGLVVYELMLCTVQVYRSKRGLSVRCEEPEVKVKSASLENEKIFNV